MTLAARAPLPYVADPYPTEVADAADTASAEPEIDAEPSTPALVIRHPVTQKHKRVRLQAKARVRIRRLKH